jgi:ankyrin repeat protein
MKLSRSGLACLLPAVLLAISTAATAADVEKARKKLAKEDVMFTEENFLKKVFSGDDKIVALFLEAGMPVDTADEKGWTALHRAAQGDSEKTLAVLLKAKPNLNAKTPNGDTPLCRAAASGPPRHVALLIQAGADVNAACSFQNTALHEAAHENSPEKVAALVAGGANVDARDDRGRTPLHLAAGQENVETANALIRGKADVNAKAKSGRTPLHEAIDSDKPAAVSALLAAGAQVDARDSSGRTPLYNAAGIGRVRLIPLLLAAGADPNARDSGGETPIKTAQRSGEKEAIALLKNAKPVPASSSASAHKEAASPTVGRAETSAPAGDPAKELKKMGLKADEKTLFERVEGRDVKAVTLILAAGVSPAARNSQGRPPLYVAVEAGADDVVRALIAGGANVNDPGASADKSMEYGDTLVMRAVDRGNPESLKALVEAKANLDKGNAYGINGLMSAAMQGRADLVEILVKGGARVNLKDKNGTPVLYSGVQGGNPDVVRILIEAGADTQVNRKLLLDAAKAKGNPRITEMLMRPPAGAGKGKKGSSREAETVVSDVAAPPVQPTYPKPVSTGTGKKPITAKQAYEMTYSVTVKWQKDAALTELTTTSEGPLAADGRSAHWVAHYYSPSAAQVYLTSIDEGKLTHSAHPSNALRTITVDADTILDSKRLLDIAEGAGGSKYSASGAHLTAGLVQNPRAGALWYFNYEDAATSKNVATIVIEAQTGKVTLADLK